MNPIKKFFEYWIVAAEKAIMPIYFIRFEDLVKDKKKVCKEIFEFMLGIDSSEGTYIEKRIDQILSEPNAGVYQPRNKKAPSIDNFNPEQREVVTAFCRKYANYFGYSRFDGEEENELN